MQCPNCYIHYDESDKKCPMCGKRSPAHVKPRSAVNNRPAAGAQRPAAKPQYQATGAKPAQSKPGYQSTQSKPAQTRPAQSTSAANQDKQRAAQKKRQQLAGVIVVIFLIIVQFIIPMINSAVSRYTDTRGSESETAILYDELYNTPALMPNPDSNNEGIYREAVLQGSWSIAGDNSDAVLYLEIDEDNEYALGVQGPDYLYAEMGAARVWFNTPEEEITSEPYVPGEYDSFLLKLFMEERETAGEIPGFLSEHIEDGEMWLILYQNRQDGEMRFVVEDWYGEFDEWFPDYYGTMEKVLDS